MFLLLLYPYTKAANFTIILRMIYLLMLDFDRDLLLYVQALFVLRVTPYLTLLLNIDERKFISN